MRVPLPPLVGGPYAMPAVRVGQVLEDARRGPVVVTRISDAPILWPVGKPAGGRRSSLVLCGDLIRAVKTEAAVAVIAHRGAERAMVSRWRKAVGAPRGTPGTTARFAELAVAKLAPHWGTAAGLRTDTHDWKAEEEALLGTAPDATIAARLGLSKQQVFWRRRSLGVPSALGAAGRAKPRGAG